MPGWHAVCTLHLHSEMQVWLVRNDIENPVHFWIQKFKYYVIGGARGAKIINSFPFTLKKKPNSLA